MDHHQYEGAFHVFHTGTFLPEWRDVYARIGAMFRRLDGDPGETP